MTEAPSAPMWNKLFGPKNAETYISSALKALARGEREQALRFAEECVAKFPEELDARLAHSNILLLLGLYDRAAATLDAIVERHPTAAWMQKAAVLEQAGRVADALAAYENAARVDPAHANAWLGWGTALANGGQHEAALAKFQRAIAADPNEGIAYYNQGNSLSRLRRFEECLASYEKALSLGHEGAHAAVRTALLQLGRAAECNRRRLPGDGQGEGRERRVALGRKSLVARYFVGKHSNPELLDGVVQGMLAHVARLEQHPPGLESGVTIQYGWSVLTVWDAGDELVLAEPDWDADPRAHSQPLVSFSAMLLAMLQVIADLTGAPPEGCSCHDTVLLEQGALEAERVAMYRASAAQGSDSGWSIRCTVGSDFTAAQIPMTALVSLAPHFLKVIALPAGWNVHFRGHEILRIFDAEGAMRFGEA